MHKTTAILISLSLSLTACAEQQAQSAPYVSPLEFKKYNCKQISKEMAYTSQAYNEAVQQSNVGAVMNTALSAFAMSQRYAFETNNNNPQIAYLQAKYEALHQASIQKNCD